MSRPPALRARRATRTAALAAGLGMVVTPMSLLAGAPAAQAATATVTVLDFNDFHGRIDANTTAFATQVEQQRAAAGEANTLLLSGGDNIGASLFSSAFNDDKATIEVLNALGVQVSAMGNHEFDKGWDWFRSHVLDGTGTAPDGTAYPAAEFPYLAANVLDSTGRPVAQASTQVAVGGMNVCVIGAVTQETPSLVSPGGIAGLTFTDPVRAVNDEVARLAAAGVDCDATIADYHEGAPQSEPVTQAEQEAASAVFRHLTQDTAPEVDVIYNAHTHQAYAYTGSRPVLQAASYGEKLGKVTMTIDSTSNTVSGVSAELLGRAAAQDLSLPRVAAVKSIVDRALADSQVIGDQPVGSITADLTRAYDAAGTEDRGAESTLGDAVANALRDGLPAELGEADLGLVNPGGLRQDLQYAGSTGTNPANTDGVVTFAEANAVLPFVNNIWTVEVTGATLKRILEQQWQPADASRPFLHLGLSDNVNLTRDASRPLGDRITSVSIDGEPVSASQTYTVSTFSFLGQGGDNFTAFTEGVPKDTGLIDRDLWIKYLQDHPGLAPDFARQQVAESGLPATVAGRDAVAFTVSELDLSSLGSPANDTLTAYADTPDGRVTLGTFPVTAGGASVALTVPKKVAPGSQLVLVAAPSGTTVARVADRVTPRLAVTVRPPRIRVDRTEPTVRIELSSALDRVDGEVEVTSDGATATATLANGAARVVLPAYTSTGQKTVTVRYRGTRRFAPVEQTVSVQVR